MTQTNAFPSYLVVQDIYGQKFHSPQGGLTRRDCFASQNYASLVAADKKTSPNYSEIAKRALVAADALETELGVGA